MQYPNAVVPVKVDKAAVSDETVEMCLVYIIMYLAVTAVSTLVLTALGTDGLTAFSGTAATLGNVGPGFGAVGSISNYSSIPEFGKWIFTANMLLGRLEIFVLILFFMPRSWR